MPANPRSQSVTDVYRVRMVALRERAVAITRTEWSRLTLANLDDSYETFRDRSTRAVTQGQREAARLSTAYIAAFLASELGHRVTTPAPPATHIGLSRDGRPLREAFDSPRIGTLAAIKDGNPDPLKVGLERAVRMASVDTDHASRASLNEAMEAHPQIRGWQRSVRGTCGACMGDIAVEVRVELPSIPLNIHPNCQCVTVPVVVGLRDRFPLPTGESLFSGMSAAQQTAALGAKAAEQVRTGEVPLKELVATSALATADDFITQTPAKDV